MSMTSNWFLIFLLAVLVIYYLVSADTRWVVLLAASYGYYLAASVPAGFFLIYSTLVTFLTARRMETVFGEHTERAEGKKAAKK